MKASGGTVESMVEGAEEDVFEAGIERSLKRLSRLVSGGSLAGSGAVAAAAAKRAGALRDSVTVPAQRMDEVRWPLPPSKSHMIRWLILAAQAEASTCLRFEGRPGEDIESVGRCLEQMSVRIERGSDMWTVRGVGPSGFSAPLSVLNCDNSCSGFRFLSVLATRLGTPVMLDGDATLRRRPSESLRSLLRRLGCQISTGESGEAMPLLLHGPLSTDALESSRTTPLELDQSGSSQPLSALLLSAPALAAPMHLRMIGSPVSNRHTALSFRLAAETGSEAKVHALNEVVLKPWTVRCPAEVEIPGDRSIEAFGMLLARLHDAPLRVIGRPTTGDSLGAEMLDLLDETFEFDLTDASDLICPLAALMAVGGGGVVTGAEHARGKESNRIESTIEMLSAFSLVAESTVDGMRVEGRQVVKAPDGLVNTHGDHRLHMTAACLASLVGATLSDCGIHAVSHPDFTASVRMTRD